MERELPRRVVYIVIDGMRTDAFEEVTASGRAPAFAFLRERAAYTRDTVAAFPSITPCATATLITGETPDRHRIPGQSWYDRDEQRFVNYGQGPRLAVVHGITEVVTDLFVNLNHRHLGREVQTLHESLDDLGFSTAATNYLVHRGRYPMELDEDAIERHFLEGALDKATLLGPKEFYFADIIEGPSHACEGHLNVRGKLKRVRATDEWAACVVRELLEKDAVDMLLLYLHENDHTSHHEGPDTQVANLERAAGLVGEVLDALGSWDGTAEEVGIVLTSDHGQTPVIKDKEHFIDLDEVLDDFEIIPAKRGKDRFEDRDLAQCGNGRAGFVYLDPDRKDTLLSAVVKSLLVHPGMDQVMWHEEGWNVVDSHRGLFHFRPAAQGGVVDERGNRWKCRGDLGAVGGIREGDRIRTPEYPLALWRIHHALALDRTGDVVVTSKLTYEVANIIDTEHRGEHGSLHAQDSLVPFLSTIGDPPLSAATTDVAPHILRHFQRLREAA